jgi:hypothetical protein
MSNLAREAISVLTPGLEDTDSKILDRKVSTFPSLIGLPEIPKTLISIID